MAACLRSADTGLPDTTTICLISSGFSRQHGEPMLHVGQHLRLDASTDFPQHKSEPGHLVGLDPTIQSKPIEPGHLPSEQRGAWTGRSSPEESGR
jgi:hypothetical protein